MTNEEIVLTLIGALQQGDMELAANWLADDFEMSGFGPKKLNKSQFLAVQSELLASMPDFSYNMTTPRSVSKDAVIATITISGTHSGTLSLPLFGVEKVPATGLAIELPETPVEFLVEQERVTRMDVAIVPGGGLVGLLQQVGSELPLIPRVDKFAE